MGGRRRPRARSIRPHRHSSRPTRARGQPARTRASDLLAQIAVPHRRLSASHRISSPASQNPSTGWAWRPPPPATFPRLVACGFVEPAPRRTSSRWPLLSRSRAIHSGRHPAWKFLSQHDSEPGHCPASRRNRLQRCSQNMQPVRSIPSSINVRSSTTSPPRSPPCSSSSTTTSRFGIASSPCSSSPTGLGLHHPAEAESLAREVLSLDPSHIGAFSLLRQLSPVVS